MTINAKAFSRLIGPSACAERADVLPETFTLSLPEPMTPMKNPSHYNIKPLGEQRKGSRDSLLACCCRRTADFRVRIRLTRKRGVHVSDRSKKEESNEKQQSNISFYIRGTTTSSSQAPSQRYCYQVQQVVVQVKTSSYSCALASASRARSKRGASSARPPTRRRRQRRRRWAVAGSSKPSLKPGGRKQRE